MDSTITIPCMTLFVNHRNFLVHLLCIPILYWGFMVVLAQFPILVFLDKVHVNISFIVTFICIFYYMLLEPIAGVFSRMTFSLYVHQF